jgi:hypothetical protein
MLASILFVTCQNFRSGGDLTTDNFDWILGADRYCLNAVDLHMPKRLEDCLFGASKSCSAMASRSGQRSAGSGQRRFILYPCVSYMGTLAYSGVTLPKHKIDLHPY